MEVEAKDRVGGGTTSMLAVLIGDVPIALVHVSAYESVPPAVGVSVLLPLVAKVPLQLPEAVQLAAFADDQLITNDWPRLIEIALSPTVGAGGTTSVKVTEFV